MEKVGWFKYIIFLIISFVVTVGSHSFLGKKESLF